MNSGKNFLSLNQEILFFLIPTFSLVKLVLLRWNFHKFSSLLHQSKPSKSQFKAKRRAVLVLIVLTAWNIYDLLVELLSEPFSYFQLFTDLLIYYLASLATDFVNTLMQILFATFSFEVCSIFQQLEESLKELNSFEDEKQSKKKIKKFVLEHREVVELLVNLVEGFQAILAITLTVSVCNLAFSFLFSETGSLIWLVIVPPFILFEIWIFCFSCQNIKTAVS